MKVCIVGRDAFAESVAKEVRALDLAAVVVADAPIAADVVVLTRAEETWWPELARNSALTVVATASSDQVTRRALDAGVTRAFGLGTAGHTRLFRERIAARLRVDVRDVHAFIVGSADAPVPLWSSATVATIPLHSWQVSGHGKLSVRDRAEIFVGLNDVENLSAQQAKAVADVLRFAITSSYGILTLSTLHQTLFDSAIEPVCLSLPTLVGKDGIDVVLSVPMNDAERAGLLHSAATLHEAR